MRWEQQEEEIQNLHKTIQSLETDLDTIQSQLAETSSKLENAEKQLGNVRLDTQRHRNWFQFSLSFFFS